MLLPAGAVRRPSRPQAGAGRPAASAAASASRCSRSGPGPRRLLHRPGAARLRLRPARRRARRGRRRHRRGPRRSGVRGVLDVLGRRHRGRPGGRGRIADVSYSRRSARRPPSSASRCCSPRPRRRRCIAAVAASHREPLSPLPDGGTSRRRRPARRALGESWQVGEQVGRRSRCRPRAGPGRPAPRAASRRRWRGSSGAGCSISDSTPPSDSARVKTLRRAADLERLLPRRPRPGTTPCRRSGASACAATSSVSG